MKKEMLCFYKYIVYQPHKNDYTIKYLTDKGIEAIKKTDAILVKEIGFKEYQIISAKNSEEWSNQ